MNPHITGFGQAIWPHVANRSNRGVDMPTTLRNLFINVMGFGVMALLTHDIWRSCLAALITFAICCWHEFEFKELNKVIEEQWLCIQRLSAQKADRPADASRDSSSGVQSSNVKEVWP